MGKYMTIFSIISIVLFSLSGLLFIAAIVVFFTTDVLASIKYLSSKDKSGSGSGIAAPSISIDHKAVNNNSASIIASTGVKSVGGIEYAQQTIDTDEIDNTPDLSFETQDWDLPKGVAFVLTRNIIVCHSDKEYMVHES
jgi:hypothetical protein